MLKQAQYWKFIYKTKTPLGYSVLLYLGVLVNFPELMCDPQKPWDKIPLDQ